MSALALKPHSRAGLRHEYCYTYANPVEVGPRQSMQLEFWIPKGRKGGEWKPAHAIPAGNYRTWRKVFRVHTHADKLAHSIGRVTAGYSRTRAQMCNAYCQWARFAGLPAVHTYGGDPVSNKSARLFNFVPIEVDAADFIGPAPTAEPHEESA